MVVVRVFVLLATFEAFLTYAYMSYAILLSNPANAMVVLPVPPDDIVNDVSGPPAFLTTSKSAVLSNTSFVVSVTVIVNAPEPFVVPVKNCCVVSDIFAKLFGLIYGVGNNKSFLCLRHGYRPI